MGIGFSSTIAGIAIASAISPKIGAVTGYLTGLATGRLFGNKNMPALLTANGVPIRVSVITNTAHNNTAEPTELTIENGARLSDHVILQPKSVSITFEVSNIEDESRNTGAVPVEWSMDSEIQKVSNIFNNNDWIPTENQLMGTLQKYNPLGRLGKELKRGDVAKSVMAQLVETMEARMPLTLATLHYQYNDMVITGIEAEEPAPYKGKLEFTVALKEVRMVALKSIGRTKAKVAGAAPKKPQVMNENPTSNNMGYSSEGII